MPTTDRDPRQLTLFETPMDRRPNALDVLVTARDARNALFTRWAADAGRATTRRMPTPRLVGRSVST